MDYQDKRNFDMLWTHVNGERRSAFPTISVVQSPNMQPRFSTFPTSLSRLIKNIRCKTKGMKRPTTGVLLPTHTGLTAIFGYNYPVNEM